MLSSRPLAYLLTWTTYGTWLPGDQRGWVRKKHGFQPPDERTERRARGLMTETACKLDTQQRQLVEAAIRSHCEIRGWFLHAVNCRSNHIHVVVTAPSVSPDVVIAQFKAWSTRKLKSRGASERPTAPRRNWWTERGSTRVLFDEKSLQAAIRYVLEGQ